MNTSKAMKAVLILAALVSTACSVKDGSVVSQPPVIKRGLTTFETEFATFQASSDPGAVSIFLWPEGLSEEEAVVKVRTVNEASNEYDALFESLPKLLVEAKKLGAEFVQSRCVEKWADDYVAIDATNVVVRKWKTGTDDASKAAIAACDANQNRRGQIQAEAQTKQARMKTLGEKIAMEIDADPRKPVNTKAIDPAGTKIVIKAKGEGQAEVEIALKDFPLVGATLSSQAGQILGANYYVSRKLLVFAVPELGANGAPTGAAYQFALERGPDFMGKARFKGEMKLVKDGAVLRYGSAKFDCNVIP